MDHGQPADDVWSWPLGRISDEAEIIRDRINRQMASEAILIQGAAGSIISKEMGETFAQLIAQMTGD